MRILQVSPNYYPELQFGGPPKKIHSLSRGLVGMGHQVEVVTLHSESPRGRTDACFDGVHVHYLPWVGGPRRKLPLGPRLLAKAVRRADVVHGYGLYDPLVPIASRLAQHYQVPYLIEPMSMYTPRVANVLVKRFFNVAITRRLFRNASRIIATAQIEFDELNRVVDASCITIRRNGIDVDEFSHLPSRLDARARFGLNSDQHLITFVGRISPNKNLEMLIRSFAALSIPDARLFLVGPELEPKYSSRIRSVIKATKQDNRVRLVGPLFGADKMRVLVASDLFVLPSLYENFGNAAGEAVMAGVPVITTETCGIAPLIDGRAGVSVPVSENELTVALTRMLLDEDFRQRVTRLRDAARHDLRWEQPIQQAAALYAEVVRMRSGYLGAGH